MNTKIGELRLHKDGYGFIAISKDEEDVFIPARHIGDALHTDIVKISVLTGRRGFKSEGKIIKVVERRVKELLGRLENAGKYYRVIADDLRVRRMILISKNRLNGAKHGQNVVVKIIEYPKGDQPMQGEIIDILGKRGDLETEQLAVMIHHQLEKGFSSKAVQEAKNCFKLINDKEFENRVDLRKLDFVTIDGITAKDFDDAIAVQRLDKENIRLWVSIADVAFFIKQDSAIDKEAYLRGTSVYFPNTCLPMLPFELSNDLCSLKPKKDRLTMTAQMDVDIEGNIYNKQFYNSVIKSKERMTYSDIKKILVDKDKEVVARYQTLLPNFKLMQECFLRLRNKRVEQGSLDFDLPEPEFVISLTGEIDDIIRAERHIGHMMIEEFMISANEAVAEFLTHKKTGCIYRVHETPPREKIEAFSILLHNLGYNIQFKGNMTPKKLAHIIEMVENKPEKRLVNTSLLRSLAKACYSSENLGHFGLASECYCHFTSPIRRYPDLIVHRLLKRALKKDKKKKNINIDSYLEEIAMHCSRREKIAMEAERETIKLHLAHFIKDKIDQEFDGIISHITKFGFFVELNDFFVEGLVHKDSLPKDKYNYDEQGYVLYGKKNNLKFRIGDKVRIKVERVDIPLREIYFALIV